MDGNPVSCDPLIVTGYHGGVVRSTFDTSFGAVVTFLCPKEGDVLVGNPALKCNNSGRWNGTVPRCMSEEDITTSTTSVWETESSSLIPPTSTSSSAEPSGFEIDTIVVLLWAMGGALLIALSVLLVCIMQSHKKARRERSALARARANPRHGGVNPSFTNYDEIWTWIPVVRDSQNQCRSQANANPSARENSANSERNLLSTLRLPSYNEAVRNTQARVGTSATHGGSSPATSTREHNVNSTVGQNNTTYRNNVTTENHYETIPADVRSSRDTGASNNVTCVSVISSNRPSVHHSSQYMPRSHATSSTVQSPRIPRHPFSRDGQRSNGQDLRRNHDHQNEHSSNTLQIRQIMNPVQSYHVSNRSSHHSTRGEHGGASEFVHSERSAFANYRERTRRVNDVIRTTEPEELSPVITGSHQSVSVTCLPRFHASGIQPSAPLASLDSVYF